MLAEAKFSGSRLTPSVGPILQLGILPVRPIVSMLLSNYNYAVFLGHAMKSVPRQTYDNFGIVVCNDGSTDNSMQLFPASLNPTPELLRFRSRTADSAPQRMPGFKYVVETSSVSSIRKMSLLARWLVPEQNGAQVAPKSCSCCMPLSRYEQA